MLGQIVCGTVRIFVGTGSGALAGTLYAGLVGAAHLGGFGRWDQIPDFAVGCVLVGAVLGLLLGCLAWALSGKAARPERLGWVAMNCLRAPPSRPPHEPAPRNG
jgi:hypothetical protein